MPTRGAELTVIAPSADGGGGEYLRLTGSIEVGDWSRFMKVMKAHPGIVGIELYSDGGSLDDGLAIAKQIYERQLDTVLVGPCHSICAVDFLAGHDRYVGRDFNLSVHTAYKQIADWTVRDHVANGTVTWFLGHMGYPLELARLWVGTEANDASRITWELNEKWQLGLQILPSEDL